MPYLPNPLPAHTRGITIASPQRDDRRTGGA